jgi:hypothetical protein
MSTKIVDLSEYGYSGKTASLRDPTGADMLALNEFIIKDKKTRGEANNYMVSLILLNRVIMDAPFDKSIETLKTLPAKLLTYLSEEVGRMMSPLAKKDENLSSPTIEEES